MDKRLRWGFIKLAIYVVILSVPIMIACYMIEHPKTTLVVFVGTCALTLVLAGTLVYFVWL